MLRQAAKLSVSNLAVISKVGVSQIVPRATSRLMSTSNRIAIDGNEAAARSAYMAADTAMIFPITPSSPMGEHCEAWAVQGKKNPFGQKLFVSELEVCPAADLLRV